MYKLLGPLVVEDSVFLKNKSSYGGGAIYTDGANIDGPKNDSETVGGTIRISGSRFEGNESRRDGGAINLYIYYPDKAIIEDSIIINNKVKPDSKGIALGGGVRANGNITIRNVTFANNIAEGQGGGLWLDGYVNSKNARATVENSTFSGNKASSTKGYGGAITINPSASANIDITNSTVVDNYAQTYGGAFWIVGKQIATLTNSIVANNKANNSSGLAQQVAFQLRDGGGNIEFPSPVNSKNKKVTAGSLIANPKLGSLQTINGVLVRPILAGSPAIDEGVTTKAPKTDIRGFNRDSQPDVGAYEYGAKAASSLTSTATQATTTSSTSSLKKATSGNDVIIGTSVSDRIIGLAGADKLTGREGNDQFVYTNISDRGDTITDFEIGKDKIVFTQLLDSLSYTGTNAIADGYVKIIQGNISNNFSVQIDVDGSTGNESFSPFITVDVKGTGTLNNASNFVF
ncbi:MAG: type I secretion C-terminal target domain-containing protein [Desmonostoc vinosum HA7617-LM4]|nr:type I secretion C-terminal target domain-containing protein [Desmonostoc vinosum HA7617-LM4]